MRMLGLFVVAFGLWLPVAAQAMTPAPDRLGQAAPRNIEQIAVHCGPHAHYVRGHRNRAGHYVKGRCIRDRPR